MSYKTPNQCIYQFLSTDGQGTGTIQANGNYSTVQGEFYITPGTAHRYAIHRMLVHIQDTGPISADEYGALTALTNGVRVVIKDGTDTEILDLLAGTTVKSNAQWGQMCYDATPSTYGSGLDFVNVRWTFAKSGNPLLIQQNHKLSVLLDDNLSGLSAHTFLVQGEIV